MAKMANVYKNTLKLSVGLLTSALLSTTAAAQSGSLSDEYPELAKYYNAFDVAQAGLFDSVLEINADPSTRDAQGKLAMQLKMMANMTMREMMAAGMNHGDAQMVMDSSYGDLETNARIELGRVVRGDYSIAEATNAFRNSDLPESAAKAISRGRNFERQIFDIYSDKTTSMMAKRRKMESAVEEYLSDEESSVSIMPKNADLYLRHQYANGLKAAFPKLSGLMWSNQWLQLASIEAIVLGQVDPQFAGQVDVTLERYRNKLGSDTGMSMFPAPTEMPTVPAIAPQLYSQAPDAAVIIDNLNMLEVAVADILAYPNLNNREEAVDAVVSAFTEEDFGLTDTEEYLTAALRGGIFNQGGPAIGELDRSERNRSRAGMDMQHTMTMSVPNH